jgi:hypothetical protein
VQELLLVLLEPQVLLPELLYQQELLELLQELLELVLLFCHKLPMKLLTMMRLIVILSFLFP